MVLSRHLVWSSFPNFASFIMKNDARSDVLHKKNLCQTMKKNMTFLRAGFEPATYGYLILSSTVHRSTNWAIEGGGAGQCNLECQMLCSGNNLLLLLLLPV